MEVKKPSPYTVARLEAIKVLTAVLSGGQALDQVLDQVNALSKSQMPGWLQDTTSGTLRWKSRLDFIIDSYCEKKKPTGWFRKALLLASYQLIVQDRVSAGSVIDETVELIKAEQGVGPASFANAVLRKIALKALEWRGLQPELAWGGERCAAVAGVPLWIWKKLFQDYGFEWTKKYCLASLGRPSLWIRVSETFNPHKGAGAWAKEIQLEGNEATPPRCFEVLEKGNISQFPGFSEGEFFVQDVSSQELIFRVSEFFSEHKLEKSALDFCAAPGGKTAGLEWSGFKVTATDPSPLRLQFLIENKQRLKLQCEIVSQAEIQVAQGQPPLVWPLVWVDAPCSGSGILRRHPDVRWLRREDEAKVLQEQQRKILNEAKKYVANGGNLMYSVCSVFKSEGMDLIQGALPEFEMVQSWTLCPHLPPFGDGFFGALLRKK